MLKKGTRKGGRKKWIMFELIKLSKGITCDGNSEWMNVDVKGKFGASPLLLLTPRLMKEGM